MNWVSLDIAGSDSGIVIWEDSVPLVIARLEVKMRPATRKRAAVREVVVAFRCLKTGDITSVSYPSEAAAWSALRMKRYICFIVIEAGFVRFPGAAMALAEARGRALTFLGAYSSDPPIVLRITPAAWRKGIKAVLGVTIPGKRDAAKKAAIEIARQVLSIKLTDDEAEAYLIGRWAWGTEKVSL